MDLISTTPYQDVAEIPDFVYHYTSLESMFAILHGFNKENRCFSFYASNIYNVNDPCEMILAFDVLKKYLIMMIVKQHVKKIIFMVAKRR